MTCDDLDSIGGFKLCDLSHFCIPSLALSKQPEKHSMHFVSYKRACVIMAACGTHLTTSTHALMYTDTRDGGGEHI